MKLRTMTMSALPTALALAALMMGLSLTYAEDQATPTSPDNASTDAAEFRKFCETAGTSETLLEKKKFLAWCEAEANAIAASPSSQAQTQPPGPETGIPSPAATVDAVDKGWRELSKRFGVQ
jgi:hypothetical protein